MTNAPADTAAPTTADLTAPTTADLTAPTTADGTDCGVNSCVYDANGAIIPYEGWTAPVNTATPTTADGTD